MDKSHSWDRSSLRKIPTKSLETGNDADEGPGCFCCDSDSDDSAEQIRIRNTNKKCARGCMNNLIICTVVIAYTFFGAILFLLIEGGGVLVEGTIDPAEAVLNDEKISAVKKNLGTFNNLTYQWIDKINAENREKTVENIWDITVNLNILYRENWTKLAAQEINRFQQQLIERITREVSASSSLTSSEAPKMISRQLIDSSHRANYAAPNHLLFEWTLAKAFLYSLTIITTIGYGNMTPRTTLGKGVAIGYAALGIPLMLVYLSSVGSVLAWCARSVFSRSLCCCLCSKCGYCCYDEKLMQEKERRMRIKREQKEMAKLSRNQEEPYYVRSPSSTFTCGSREDKLTNSIEETNSKIEHRHFVAPLMLCLIIMVIYIVGGGVVLCRLDKQLNYLNSIYFCFMLLTTIGYIENIFTDNHILSLRHRSSSYSNIAVWFCSFYIIFGMALTAMCFSIIHEEVINRLKQHYNNLLTKHEAANSNSNLQSKEVSLLTKLASASSSNTIENERGISLQYNCLPNS